MSIDFFRLNGLFIAPCVFFIFGTLFTFILVLKAPKPYLESIELPVWNFQENIHLSENKKEKTFLKEALVSKDPFKFDIEKPTKAQKALPPLKLSMIIINKRHKICKINGQIYTEGENATDFSVKRITDEKVLVERSGKREWLYLSKTL